MAIDTPKQLSKITKTFQEDVTKKGTEGTINKMGKILRVTTAKIPNVKVHYWLPNEPESNGSSELVPLNVFLTSVISGNISGIID